MFGIVEKNLYFRLLYAVDVDRLLLFFHAYGETQLAKHTRDVTYQIERSSRDADYMPLVGRLVRNQDLLVRQPAWFDVSFTFGHIIVLPLE